MTDFYTDLNLLTESDVEQKFIVKLLTNPYPIGLGYSDADYRTKQDIRRLIIDKGGKPEDLLSRLCNCNRWIPGCRY